MFVGIYRFLEGDFYRCLVKRNGAMSREIRLAEVGCASVGLAMWRRSI